MLRKILCQKYGHLDIAQVQWILSDSKGEISHLFITFEISYSALIWGRNKCPKNQQSWVMRDRGPVT